METEETFSPHNFMVFKAAPLEQRSFLKLVDLVLVGFFFYLQ